jgi:Zn-dependent protease
MVAGMDLIYTVSVWLLPVLIAITFHEAAHGYVARFLGDETASRLGRVSLNPVRHIDPFGTIILPGLLLLVRSPFLFGYAKPVPVNFRAQSWPQESEQRDKWSFCLTAGKIDPRIRRDDEQTSTPEPHTGFQGEGGASRHQGRDDAVRTGTAV